MLLRPRPCAAQALVEFALVLPLVLALSLGALQLVLYAHAHDVVLSAVQEAARLSAEDGRSLDDGYARARELVAAGLGGALDAAQLTGSMNADSVQVRLDGSLRPILPLPPGDGLPLHAEARMSRERFRPGGR